MACTRNQILNLYRNLIRESKKWNTYNFRMYALRKVRHEFQQNKTLQDKIEIEQFYQKGQEALEVIKRQVIIGNLYSTRPLIIETNTSSKSKYNNKLV
ncbi:PREDICTED: protein bcn92-like [Polistes canadensis]|uniref:protein bcn92-like n=1 Tax=Polistes canadensis TaxID=91411 RepID=UPI00071905AA|nr:PREDICTED: protein bcn92-like [Polistes canadensis]